MNDHSDYYEIGTPVSVPLRFCSSGYYRVAAKASCRKCGRSFMQVLRCHRISTAEAYGLTPPRLPDPNDEQIVTSLLRMAEEHGVGADNRDSGMWYKPGLHAKGCPVGRVRRSGPMLVANVDVQGRARWGRA